MIDNVTAPKRNIPLGQDVYVWYYKLGESAANEGYVYTTTGDTRICLGQVHVKTEMSEATKEPIITQVDYFGDSASTGVSQNFKDLALGVCQQILAHGGLTGDISIGGEYADELTLIVNEVKKLIAQHCIESEIGEDQYGLSRMTLFANDNIVSTGNYKLVSEILVDGNTAATDYLIFSVNRATLLPPIQRDNVPIPKYLE